MDLSVFETDKDLEVSGVWVDLDKGDGSALLIARIGNTRFNTAVRERMRPYRRMIQSGKMSEDTQEEILTEVMAETILLDWKNIKLNGKTLKYSPKQACDLMRKLPDFRELVTEIANSMDTFRKEEVEEDEKNSKAP